MILKKGESKQLSKNINQREVDCKCKHEDCTTTTISEKLIRDFQNLRDQFGTAIKVNSAYRCQRHNADVGGKTDSRHKLGLALDLVPPRDYDLEDFAMDARKHFDYVQIYYGQNFIHCHNLGE